VTIAALAACRPTSTSLHEDCLSRAVFGNPALSAYTLPYPVGSAYMVTQSYCTFNSHSNQLAYDFRMPIGSAIVAAREGIVAEIVDQYTDNEGDSKHHNHILIRHDDGSTAFYAHLHLHSLAVGLNERVGRGQLIALSGSSGSPGNPHLHFGVYRTYLPVEGDDLAVNFRNAEGPLDSRGGLQEGVTYLAAPY
jgi:murein DD-endopeptidase MepM/ murein hydrolase activator NlpD